MLGGGGYTIRNVARCWTNETAIALGVEIANGDYWKILLLSLHKVLSPAFYIF